MTTLTETPTPPAPAAPGNAVTRGIAAVFKRRETSIVIAILVVIAAATLVNDQFLLSNDGFRNLLLNPSIYILLSVGVAMVIITRSVDLSVSSTLGLTAYLTGRMFIDFPGIPIIAVFLIGIIFGGFLGLINGALVAYARVPAMVITLGTMYAYRGINVAWAGSNRINPQDMPKGFTSLGTAQILSIPVLTIIAVVVLIALAWYMKNTRGGREFYALGSDPEAAQLYGLNVVKRNLVAFVLCGAMAGLAGVLYTARYGTVDSAAGYGVELTAIGGAVIGGVAISGGVGTLWGAAFGAILLLTIKSALPVLGIQDFWQQAVVGVLIIGAIVLDRVLALRQHKKLLTTKADAS
ncbi:ABC transporter permease [Klugiella xanthotipulae]|uniref:Autoinducer 2 import system permease protein LsrC n=1 Tax=Klugiella xanthotipulae TaxID=244735 RepID=A0A543HH05_9MICO|nr:ABC transporter permease [Klugiella xanthotipulae]TQM57606.1 rhamnose transport system permease protein [Klugiella xanthotipulae]